MNQKPQHKLVIGLVLSTVPKYSETFFRNKIKGLQDHGFDVVLFVDYTTPEDTNFPCKVIAAPNFGNGKIKALWYSLMAILKSIFLHPKRSYRLYVLDKKDGLNFKKRLKRIILNQFLLTQRLDWLHFGFGMLAVDRENVAAAIQAKMAVSFRGFDLYLSPLKHKGCYEKLFLKAVQYHVLSQEMKQDLVNSKISQDRIKVIPPAINIDFFKSEPLRKESKVIKIVTVARLHWKKGLEYTLEALAILKQKGISFHYTIIGDGQELERLIFAAHQLQIAAHITFAGKKSHHDVKHQMEQSDIYLQYSIQEGFCNAVLEAQAMGLMCVVSNAEGLSENVLNNKTGWVIPKRNPKLLAQKIEDVINLSPKDKDEIRTHAIQRVRATFNLENQNKAFFEFYTSRVIDRNY